MPSRTPLVAVAIAILAIAVLVYAWPRDAEPDIANPPSPESSSAAIDATEDQVDRTPTD